MIHLVSEIVEIIFKLVQKIQLSYLSENRSDKGTSSCQDITSGVILRNEEDALNLV